MRDLVDQVEQELCSRDLVTQGESLAVAVSGGLDSMVLLEVLQELRRKHAWSLTVLHFNHGLRGAESDEDENLCRRRAGLLQLPFRSVRGAVTPGRESLEMAAREARHRFLAESARELGIKKVLLAHHADDQVELFFLRLVRGAGTVGLAGMRWARPSPVDPEIQLIRPLLAVTRAELQAYAAERKVDFREDASNASLDHLRNRVRHELLPWLRQVFQGGVDASILRTMEVVGAEAEVVLDMAQRWLAEKQPHFDELFCAVQRRVILLQLLGVGVVPDFQTVERLRRRPSAAVSTGTGQGVWRNADGTVMAGPVAWAGFRPESLWIDLSGTEAGRTRFGDLEVEWETEPLGDRPPAGPGCEYFDRDQVGDGLLLRHWQPGDRFQPIGLDQPVKLQDLFTNLKVPAAERRTRVLAVTARDEVVWVEGVRISEGFKLDKRTRRRLKWQWRRSG